jgi:hypothetical protein
MLRFLALPLIVVVGALAGCAGSTDPGVPVPKASAHHASAVDHTPTAITMPTSDWLAIDATMDNFTQDSTDDGVSADAKAGSRIHDAGFAQIPDWPKTADGFAHWPAKDQKSTITLRRSDWDVVERALDADAKVYRSMAKGWKPTGSDDDYAAMAGDSAREAAMVRAALAGQ